MNELGSKPNGVIKTFFYECETTGALVMMTSSPEPLAIISGMKKEDVEKVNNAHHVMLMSGADGREWRE